MRWQLVPAFSLAILAGCDDQQPLAAPADAPAALEVAATPLRYQWIPLDTRGDGYASTARAINNQQQVIGSASQTEGQSQPVHAVLWEHHTMVDLGTLGGANSVATEINDQGQVVGLANAADGAVHAFFWENGTMQDLGSSVGFLPSGTFGMTILGAYPLLWSPVRINQVGQVIGNRPNGDTFLWERGVAQVLPLAFATGINDQGDVVGWVMRPDSTGALQRRAALWSGGVLTDLGTLGGAESWAVAVSNSGWVVGTSQTEPRWFYGGWNRLRLPFRWRDGRMEGVGVPGTADLGLPGNEFTWYTPPFVSEHGLLVAKVPFQCSTMIWYQDAWQGLGCVLATPQAMNGHGAMTGSGSFGAGIGLVWQDGVRYDLEPGLDEFSRGHAINDSGVVAGQTMSSGAQWQFPAAAIWIPVGLTPASLW